MVADISNEPYQEHSTSISVSVAAVLLTEDHVRQEALAQVWHHARAHW